MRLSRLDDEVKKRTECVRLEDRLKLGSIAMLHQHRYFFYYLA